MCQAGPLAHNLLFERSLLYRRMICQENLVFAIVGKRFYLLIGLAGLYINERTGFKIVSEQSLRLL
jgi:hypothetical protein